MGMHFAVVAVPAGLEEFRRAFAATWPNHEPGRTRTGFTNYQDVWDWSEENKNVVYANDWSLKNPGSEVYLFYQDGPWAVMVDPSYVLASDEQGLSSLSSRFGKTLSIVIETTGGCANFDYYEQGVARRSVQYMDGEMKSEGERLPEERGLDKNTFYMNEVEQLMTAFGLSQIGDESVAPRIQAVELIDRNDYTRSNAKIMEDLGAKMVSAQEGEPAKPWWKFW
jgi:hypothetical protein